MRQSLVIVATGVVSGVVGALITARMTARGVASAAPSAPARPPPAVIVPPGWDPNWSARLSQVESELADNRAKPTPPSEKTVPSAEPSGQPSSSREEERMAHYQKEVAYHTQLLAEHGQEPIDQAWSWEQSQTVRTAFEMDPARLPGLSAPDRLQVDCRSKTCIAKLTFPSSPEGLRYLHMQHIPMPVGCNGMTSTPLPHKGNGPYDLNIIYTCRQ